MDSLALKTQQSLNVPGIRWTSKTEYYDIETGDQITKHNAETNYIKLKTNKHVTFNHIKTTGTIKRTIECRRNPQITIW